MFKQQFNLLMLTILATGMLLAQDQDTASVTYQPGADVYLLQYTVDGISYTDTLVPATRIRPIVRCRVSTVDSSDLYNYSYQVSLLPSSQQSLISFAVCYKGTILAPQKPNPTWITWQDNDEGTWEWSNSLKDSSGLRTPNTDIIPGGGLSGFSFRSEGRPTIVNSYYRGNAPLLAFSGEPPSLMEKLVEPLFSLPKNTVRLATIGPGELPSSRDAIAFLDTLKSYVQSARALQWIGTQATAQEYLLAFNAAQSLLLRADSSSAISALRQIIASTSRDNLLSINGEAFALIHYNTRILLERLQHKRQSRSAP